MYYTWYLQSYVKFLERIIIHQSLLWWLPINFPQFLKPGSFKTYLLRAWWVNYERQNMSLLLHVFIPNFPPSFFARNRNRSNKQLWWWDEFGDLLIFWGECILYNLVQQFPATNSNMAVDNPRIFFVVNISIVPRKWDLPGDCWNERSPHFLRQFLPRFMTAQPTIGLLIT